MGQFILQGDPPVSVNLRRSGRARRLSLRVSRLDGRVTLSLPKGAARSEAVDFVLEKEDWIRGQLQRRPDEVVARIGGSVLFEGVDLPIVAARRRAAALGAGVIEVPGQTDRVGVRIAAFLKTAARVRLRAACDHHAGRVGRQYHALSLRDTRSRWGSCSSEAKLMFSWRLVMAPPEVLQYVAAHEVAHLVEMNHSGAFWAVVADLYPDYGAPRRWLRANGAILHSYRFDN
jgi:predicted metal-dependent hydrolase